MNLNKSVYESESEILYAELIQNCIILFAQKRMRFCYSFFLLCNDILKKSDVLWHNFKGNMHCIFKETVSIVTRFVLVGNFAFLFYFHDAQVNKKNKQTLFMHEREGEQATTAFSSLLVHITLDHGLLFCLNKV